MTISSSGSNGERAGGNLTPSQTKTARILFYSGWGITLLYFPSGLLHFMLGSGVYGRDLLLAVHLLAGVVWLGKTGKFAAFARRSWLLTVPAIFILPAIFNGLFTVEALTFIKWTAFWLDWIVMGSLALVVVKGLNTATVIFAVLTALLLIADLGAGVYEKATNAYIFHVQGEVSAFGVEEDKEISLASHLRVKGLQRDVFSFSNMMAMSCVAGFLAFITCEEIMLRFGSALWAGTFGIGMFASGGRSAFFGVFAAALITGGLLFMPELVRKYYGRLVLAWLLIALTISFVGVGALTESIGSSVMSGSHIGNSASAYMRDTAWTGIVDAIEGVPVVLVSGGPLASLLDPKVDAIYHWADNQYLWFLYHSGVVGFIAMGLYFAQMLRMPPAGGRTWLHDAMVMYLVFVMGEAIARESLTFIGCMPLFIACGCHDDVVSTVARIRNKPSSRRSRGAPVKTMSSSSDFARRVRSAERREE